MIMRIQKIKYSFCFLALMFMSVSGFSQTETSTWKAQFAVGINSPSQSAFVTNFEAKPVNFPTVHIGLQRMLNRNFGAKLDYGYNRISNATNSDSPEFKINYSRINIQAVYDLGSIIRVPNSYAIMAHAGPGYTFVKPLGVYTDNNTSFLNAMAGLEFHYGISQGLSVFLDTSYIYAFSSDYDTTFDGFGTFNGNLLTATIGVSISLSGCYYCQ
ncbi:outer membrane beta-barrel protein [Lacinutrix gracilariae]|uniref:Outer membrane beta-barrel protein n=2 Tax=Lacinutrix gracilariae TaxID=1747198 RepID=A0ABW5K6S0_9FLAO